MATSWAGTRGQTIIQLSVNDYVLETLMTFNADAADLEPNPTTRKMACRSWSTWTAQNEGTTTAVSGCD